MNDLNALKGIGPKTINTLNQIGINSINDLVTFYPFRYNLIKRSLIDDLKQDDKIIIDGKIETIPNMFRIKKNLDRMSFKINTGTHLLNVVIFNRGFLKPKLKINTPISLIGKYDKKHNMVIASEIKLSFLPPTEKIEPVYHMTYKINVNSLKKYINLALDLDYEIDDYIPYYLSEKYRFMSKKEAIKIVHRPSSVTSLKQARLRLKYEELFVFMMRMNYLRMDKKNKIGLKREVDYDKVLKFIDKLSFSLTLDQMKAVKNIYDDLISPKRMNRLLQGDVGSGKTIVSFIAMYINYLSGYQSALMAPTEILAKQHYENIIKVFDDKVNIVLLTGKLKAKEKKEIYKDLSEGKIDIIIGTHALISDNVNYANLGLVITDEQHRFGVNQRSNLKNKGYTPDILYMSATPIPRTYALTLYGDMDISNIKTMPKGRKEVKTILKSEKEIKDVLEMMLNELKANHQIYVVAPLIEESDKVNLKDVGLIESNMQKAFGKYYNIGVLHGRMSNDEKDEIMNKFKNNEIQILISTTVIEVGVDVANATMMVIFDSYRFGLSALHQLRGRVGRSMLDSYCVLVSDYKTKRLEILTETNDGFKISEEDFLLRGSGDLFGIKQSGDMSFLLADVKKDYKILLKAKEDSANFLNNLDKYNDQGSINLKRIIKEASNLD